MSRRPRWASPEDWAAWMATEPEAAYWSEDTFRFAVLNRWSIPTYDARSTALWQIFRPHTPEQPKSKSRARTS